MIDDPVSIIKEIGNGGKKTPEETIVPKPHLVFNQVKKTPQKFIDLLYDCSGDVGAFKDLFAIDSRNTRDTNGGMDVIMRTLLILNEPENLKLKAQWNSLIESYKQAKVLLAQYKAYEFIGGFSLDPSKARNMNAYSTLARVWLTGHTTAETTKAKRVVNDNPISEERNEMEDIKEELLGDAGD